jgi:hypothetical protein
LNGGHALRAPNLQSAQAPVSLVGSGSIALAGPMHTIASRDAQQRCTFRLADEIQGKLGAHLNGLQRLSPPAVKEFLMRPSCVSCWRERANACRIQSNGEHLIRALIQKAKEATLKPLWNARTSDGTPPLLMRGSLCVKGLPGPRLRLAAGCSVRTAGCSMRSKYTGREKRPSILRSLARRACNFNKLQ